MVNYNETKFYILKCQSTNKYIIGATTKKYLSQKLTQHREQYKKYIEGKVSIFKPAFHILKNDDYYIMLISTHKCKNKEEVEKLKNFYINNYDLRNKEKN
jgi:hypothetical protein